MACHCDCHVPPSDYVRIWGQLGGLPTNAEQDFACMFLEGKGLKFCVHYGYENALTIAQSYGDWRKPGRA
jgi:hypothetical protein